MSEDIDIGKISEALNNKTDRDFNNMNPSSLSKETIVGWGMPDYSSAVSIEYSLSTNYTCQKLGYYVCLIDKAAGNSSPTLKVNGVTVGAPVYSNTYDCFYTTLFCDIGDVISAESASTRKVVSYFPPKGVN